MAIVLAGEGGSGGSSGTPFSTPGPVIDYISTNGNTLIATGQIESSTGAITGITSISDSAGNQWQYSVVNSQFPPSVTADSSFYFCSFVGWCISALAITSVSLTGNVGNTSGWMVSISEWTGISAADDGVALTGTNANPSATVGLTYSGDLVVGSIDTQVGAPSALPPGWTGFGHVGSPRVFAGYSVQGNPGFYTAQWAGTSTTYTLALMSFYSTGAVAAPSPAMRRF